MSRTRSGLTVLFLAAVLAAVPALFAQEKPAVVPPVMQKFNAGMKLYVEGNYAEALKLFDEVIKAKPSSHEALLMREEAGMGVLVKMLRDPAVRDVATLILRRAAEESLRLQRDAATIKQYVEQTGNEEFVQRETAVRRLVAIGPFAVPPLLDQALTEEPLSLTSRRVAALRIIREMGSAGIPPLLVAFVNARPEDAIRIARMIEESPDARSVPVLAAAVQDKNTPDFVRKAAEKALAAILDTAEAAPAADARKDAPKQQKPQVNAAQLCLELASRYYYNDVALIEIVPVWQRVIWTWNPAGKLYAERLVAEEVPPYVYPRRLAESLLTTGMKHPHAQPDFLELTICNNYMQIADARAANDAARVTALEPLRRANESLGAAYLYRALGRALKDGTMPLAQDCVAALRAIADPRIPRENNTLIPALAAPDKVVRAGAAEALMFLSPSGDAGATQEVISTAAASLGAALRPRILVLTQDDALFKSLSAGIASWNMVPERCMEQLAAITRVRSMAPPVSLLMFDARLKGASPAGTMKLLRAELAERTPPAILLAAPEVAKKLGPDAALFAATLPLPPPAADLMKTAMAAVETSRTSASEDILQNAEMVKRMLATLAALPRSTKYPVNELAGTMTRLSSGYPQDIRIPAMQVIAVLPTGETRDAMYAIFASATDPVEVRRAAGAAFLNALGFAPLLPPDQLEAVRKLTADVDKELSAQAVHALSIADIPQAEREAKLLDVGPKAK